MRSRDAAWLSRRPPNPARRLRLFCFPHAGGSAAAYYPWPPRLPAAIELAPVQLPGRGARAMEPAFTNAIACAEAAAQALLPLFDEPFALFGHSMGAVIAFELARHLQGRFRITPIRLFVLGRSAPHVALNRPSTWALPDAEFLESVRSLNGTPDELLNDPEAMALILPRLRADFELVQTYAYRPGPPLACPIRVFGGQDDESVPKESLREWQRHTARTCSVDMIEGDHFSTLTNPALLGTVVADLCQALGLGRVNASGEQREEHPWSRP